MFRNIEFCPFCGEKLSRDVNSFNKCCFTCKIDISKFYRVSNTKIDKYFFEIDRLGA